MGKQGEEENKAITSFKNLIKQLSKRRWSDFSESIFLVALGLVAVFMFKNPTDLNSENTTKVEGILAENPVIGSDDDGSYMGLWVLGYSDFYEFSKCSYSSEIENKIKTLKEGDLIVLHVKNRSSSVTHRWNGEKYKTYKICDAYSPHYGYFLHFDQYNSCKKFKSEVYLPLIGAIILVIGLFNFFKTLCSSDNIMDTTYLSLANLESEDGFHIIYPDRISFIGAGSSKALILVAVGLVFLHVSDIGEYSYIGILFLIAGVYVFIHAFFVFKKIYYIIDKNGIHIKHISMLFRQEMETIKFDSIKEVKFKQGHFESYENVATILIHTGKYDSDGDEVYSKLIGVENFIELTELLKKKAGLG